MVRASALLWLGVMAFLAGLFFGAVSWNVLLWVAYGPLLLLSIRWWNRKLMQIRTGGKPRATEHEDRNRLRRLDLDPGVGYLETVCSHSLQPYRGCPFGASLCGVGCYVRHNIYVTRGGLGGLPGGPIERGGSVPRGYDRERGVGPGEAGGFVIFLSSATEPFPPQEARHGSRDSVLRAMLERPPDGLIVQTHSPRVAETCDGPVPARLAMRTAGSRVD